MKNTIVVALAVTITGTTASSFESRALERLALERRGIFGGDSTTNVKGGSAGAGGKSKSGQGGTAGKATGAKVGTQFNTGANGGRNGKAMTEMQNAQTGMIAGNAGGGSVSGTVTNNQAAPFMFGGGMFDRANSYSINNIGNGMGGVANGGYAGVSGTNNNRNGGYGDGNGNGGTQGGSSLAFGNTSANGGKSGNSRGGVGGAADVGGGNTSQGGKGSLDFSPTLSIPAEALAAKRKRALESRAFELEEEYTWILQQKRDIEAQELIARFAVTEDEGEYLSVRSEDPDTTVFSDRSVDFDIDDEDFFHSLNARDVLDAFFLMTSEF